MGAGEMTMREQLKITGLLAFVVVLYIIGGWLDA